ncbi:MAG: STAS domain-containing protein [Planktomarina sp.]
MQIEITQEEDRDIVHLNGSRLDAYCALKVKKTALRLVTLAERDVVIDMGKVDFIDSSGLGVLVSVAKMVADKHAVYFINLQPLVQRVFKLTHMDRVFNILEDDTVKGTAA